MGSPPSPKFCDSERVLCFHGPLIYEGKVLKFEFRENEKEWAYWIHYAGWSKNWDEWVYERRVLKFSDSNLEKQKELKAAHDESLRVAKNKASAKNITSKKKSLGSDTSSVNMSTTDSRSSTPVMDQKSSIKGKGSVKIEPMELEPVRRKRKNECVEPENHYNLKQEVHIMIPEQLKIFLVDDWDSVTRQKRLVNLPARITIEQIFEEYLKDKPKKDQNAEELCSGLRMYFNTMIGNQLLYRFERSQYEQLLNQESEKDKEKEEKKPTLPMTEYYGAAHLLRLFTKLGGCLTYTNLDPEAVGVLRKCIEDFFKFILKNFDTYFSLEDYGVSCPEYQRKPT